MIRKLYETYSIRCLHRIDYTLLNFFINQIIDLMKLDKGSKVMDFILRVASLSPKFCYSLKKSLEVQLFHAANECPKLKDYCKKTFILKCKIMFDLMMSNQNQEQKKFMSNQDFILNRLGKVSSDLLSAKNLLKTQDELETILKNMLKSVNEEIINSDET